MSTQTLTISAEGTYTPVGYADEGGNYTRLQSDDGDTSRLYTPTNGSTRSLLHTATSGLTGATINSVTVYAKTRLLDPGITRPFKLGVRISGTNYLGPDINLNTNAYTLYSYTMATNPATSAAWTPSQIDAAEYLISKTSVDGQAWTYAYMEVDYTTGGGGGGISNKQYVGFF